MDVDPVVKKPTYRNNRVGDARISKMLDHFLLSNQLIQRVVKTMTWVSNGGMSDHRPIFLQVDVNEENHAAPFKFNPLWLKWSLGIWYQVGGKILTLRRG